MKYEICGNQLPVLTLTLQKGETINTESGAMSWMSDGMEMKTNAGGAKKVFSRMFSGETLFLNSYTASKDGDILAVSSSFPGDILAIDVAKTPIIAQKQAFLAKETTVDMSIFFQKKLGAGFFGGEGFIMQKFSGKGYVFIEIDGSTVTYDLKPGESMILDTGYLAAMEQTVNMQVVTVKGFKNMIFGGEGIFNTKVTGPGRIWIQSMPKYKLLALIPQPK